MARLRLLLVLSFGIAVVVVAALGLRFALAPAYDGSVGILYAKAFAPARDRSIDVSIWYPADPGGRTVTVGGNGVFYGTPAGKGAPHRTGRAPLVLISHGAGGNAGQYGWIASRLAEAGFVVALPNHPGSTSGDASAAEAVRLWKRPADLSATIDAIAADPALSSFVDTDRVAALGFSAGGYTALAVAGAIVDPIRLASFCDGAETGMSDCAFLARGGVDLHAMDLSPAGEPHRDARVSAAVVVDPGTVQTLTSESLRAISIPVLIVNLGRPGEVPPAVLADEAARLIPDATYETVEDAIHFSFLAECKPKGREILQGEGEVDPLCDDGGGRTRAKIHEALGATIVSYLAAKLSRP